MKFFKWQTCLGFFLVILSIALYFLHFLIFRDSHHIFLYLLGDLAFVPIEVLFVTLIIHKLLGEREKRLRVKKLNMVIGAFFSEVGTGLISDLAVFDINAQKVRGDLKVLKRRPDQYFYEVRKRLRSYEYTFDARRGDLMSLKDFLARKRNFLLALLGNHNLLEHESFTEALWAVFHLTEEISCRRKLDSLPDSDCEHLAGDMARAYRTVLFEWIDYMRHLKADYPYLFSLAMRTNPFDNEAVPEVT